jgi:O-antigen/teichoic acid export membrane protein
LGASAALSVLQVVIAGVILFFFYRFLVRTIGMAAVGIWSVVLATTVVGRIAHFGFAGALARFVARANAQGDGKESVRYVQTAMLSSAAILAATAILLLPTLKFVLASVIAQGSLTIVGVLAPWAVLSFWVSNVTAVVQGALDGALRVDLRNAIMIGSSILYVALGVPMVSAHGLMGLAYAQVLQGVTSAVITWLVLRSVVPGLPLVPRRWDYAIFRELLGFGWRLQVVSIAVLLLEPTTKVLLARFGGLAAAGYYEMATRLVQQVRALVVNAGQVLVPAIADSHERDKAHARALYRDSYNLVSLVVVPMAGALIVVFPAVSELWIGRYAPQFVTFASLLTVGWFANALTAPSYYAAIGMGQMRWNIVGHVVMAVVNLGATLLLGVIYGAVGVVVGTLLALLTGTVITGVKNHLEQGEPLADLLPRSTVVLILTCGVGSGLSVLLYHLLRPLLGLAWSITAALALYAVFTMLGVWWHPHRTRLAQVRRLLTSFISQPRENAQD